MLTGLFFGAIVVLFMVFGAAIAVPFLLIGALIWLVLLPFRILFHLTFGLIGGIFKVLFGLGGALLGIVVLPVVLIIAGVALVGAFFVAVLGLLAPLIPTALLALLGWGIYRLFVRPATVS